MKTSFFPLLALLVSALLTSGCRQAATTGEEPAQAAPVTIAFAEEREGLDEWTELTGATQAPPGQLGCITAPFEAQVDQIVVASTLEGQEVQEGELIVQLRDKIALANKEKAQAALEEHRQLMEQAHVACALAQLEVDRLKKLEPANMVGTHVPLVSYTETEKARLGLLDAQSKLAALEGHRKSLEADLKTASIQWERHKLRAPISGHLGTIQIVPGQTLTLGTLVAEVIDLKEIDVVAFVTPRTAADLQQDQEAQIVVQGDEAPAKTTPKGEVVYIASKAQSDTGNFQVKIRFPNEQLQLKANQIVNVKVQTEEAKKRWTIPEAAVMDDQDPPVVIIAEPARDENGKEPMYKARKLNATLGVRAEIGEGEHKMRVVEIRKLEDPDNHTEVELKGTRFITEGAHGLSDGDVLKIEEGKKD